MGGDADFNVYAIKLQPAGEAGFFEACRDEEVIGTGWDPMEPGDSPAAIEQAHKRIDRDSDYNRTNKNGDLRHELRYIVKEMTAESGDSTGDYVWVNEGAQFAICKVVSECTTSHDVSDRLKERLTNDNGTQIHNIRHVEWTDVPVEFVPGYVKRKFTGRFGTLNRMKKGVDSEAKGVIQELHSVDDFDDERNIDYSSLRPKLESLSSDRLFDTLDADDTEEAVLNYLQASGWRITKYSTGDSQAKYECELRRVSDGHRETGFVQVKSGDASINPENYTDLADEGEVFLFETPGGKRERLSETDFSNITVIEPEDLSDHLLRDLQWLPVPTLLRLSFSI